MSGGIGSRERAFAAAVTAAILAVVLIGFSRSFFLRPLYAAPPPWAAKEAIFHAHGTIFAGWFALLASIRSRNVKLHRSVL